MTAPTGLVTESVETLAGVLHAAGSCQYQDVDLCGELAQALIASGAVRPAVDVRAEAWDEGVRQAVAWLQADYPPYSGPEWREHGVEWIEGRLADHRRAALAEEGEGR